MHRSLLTFVYLVPSSRLILAHEVNGEFAREDETLLQEHLQGGRGSLRVCSTPRRLRSLFTNGAKN